MNISDLSLQIKQKALETGFSGCGISKAESLNEEANYLKAWLTEGRHGEMQYMENYFDKRTNPAILFENAKSVISVLFNYYPDEKIDQNCFQIAKYAYGNDYHNIVKSKLNEIIDFIKIFVPDVNARAYCDSAPVMDKVWAERSGLGWIGKNTCLIAPNAGSFFLIGEIITDIELSFDKAIKNRCGNCQKCIDSCPSFALTSPYQLDARKCISYLTIEFKSDFKEDTKLKNYIFGCDICQDVCPWNIRFAKAHKNSELNASEIILKSGKADWESLTKKEFKKYFKNSAIERTGFERLKRNITKNKKGNSI